MHGDDAPGGDHAHSRNWVDFRRSQKTLEIVGRRRVRPRDSTSGSARAICTSGNATTECRPHGPIAWRSEATAGATAATATATASVRTVGIADTSGDTTAGTPGTQGMADAAEVAANACRNRRDSNNRRTYFRAGQKRGFAFFLPARCSRRADYFGCVANFPRNGLAPIAL